MTTMAGGVAMLGGRGDKGDWWCGDWGLAGVTAVDGDVAILGQSGDVSISWRAGWQQWLAIW